MTLTPAGGGIPILNGIKQQAFFGVPAAFRYQRNISLGIAAALTVGMKNKILLI